jgi:hypothetical protein
MGCEGSGGCIGRWLEPGAGQGWSGTLNFWELETVVRCLSNRQLSVVRYPVSVELSVSLLLIIAA